MRQLRYLLLQTRNPGDPMAAQEVRCFARALDCEISAISVRLDWLRAIGLRCCSKPDMLLLGGSGHYSVASRTIDDAESNRPHSPWLDRTLDALREIHQLAKPTFASCWGFQAMARAMGGECVNDVPNAEVGTVELQLTDVGSTDPDFRNSSAAVRGPSWS